jgi:hypothetical protein
VTYVTDRIESAMAQAKAAAGDRDVIVWARLLDLAGLRAEIIAE